jgi:chromosomal replication initiation ATPase DnaA
MLKEIERIRKREKRIINTVAIAEITLEDMKEIFAFCHETKSRVPDVVELRHFSRYFLCMNTEYILKRIGTLTNCKDHATVIHSRNSIEQHINRYPNTMNAYIAFEEEIMGKIEKIYNAQVQVPVQEEELEMAS